MGPDRHETGFISFLGDWNNSVLRKSTVGARLLVVGTGAKRPQMTPHSILTWTKGHVQALPLPAHEGPRDCSWPPSPVPWGSPKSTPSSPRPHPVALSILRVIFLIPSRTQACDVNYSEQHGEAAGS